MAGTEPHAWETGRMSARSASLLAVTTLGWSHDCYHAALGVDPLPRVGVFTFPPTRLLAPSRPPSRSGDLVGTRLTPLETSVPLVQKDVAGRRRHIAMP